jgi:hypothetical protein
VADPEVSSGEQLLGHDLVDDGLQLERFGDVGLGGRHDS